MSETGLTVRNEQALEHRPFEALIVRAMDDQNFDVEKLERLMAMMERKEAQERKEKFFSALARVQMAAPRITKYGLMDRGAGKGQIKFAKREDIDAVMRPIYQAEGFSVNWDAPMHDGKIRVIGRFTAFGHTEEREWWCAPDASGGKQGPQASGSTTSYGQRYISIMFWDIITEDEDKNGAKREDVEPISQNQADDIRTRMNDLPQKAPGNLLSILCRKYGVEKIEELKAGQLAAALVDVVDTEKRKVAR